MLSFCVLVPMLGLIGKLGEKFSELILFFNVVMLRLGTLTTFCGISVVFIGATW